MPNKKESLGAFPVPEAMAGADRAPAAMVLYHDSPSAVKPRRGGFFDYRLSTFSGFTEKMKYGHGSNQDSVFAGSLCLWR
jgi:hypothetical protein